jgi:hypothetical protein
MEGNPIKSANFFHSSGPFGLDVFYDNNWTDFVSFRDLWSKAVPDMSKTWFDCHAWLPTIPT